MDFTELMVRFGTALGAGLLVGLQRQYAKLQEADDVFAGTRTFALIGLLGAMSAYVAQEWESAFIFIAVMVVLGAYVGISYAFHIRGGDIGLTTEIAALLTFLIGAIAAAGHLTIAAASAVGITTLLALKPWTEKLVQSIDAEDLQATLRFAVVAALLLPLLPDEPLGPPPWDAASPFQIGLMVVFISGLSFLGYALIKVVGARRGVGLTGVLGGLVSSTAVTLTMAERSREATRLLPTLAMTVMLAWSIMYGRVLVEVLVVNRDLVGEVVLPVVVGGLILIGWAAALYWRDTRQPDSDGASAEFANPFRLRPAIQFGLLYGVVLIGSKAASMYLGSTGVYTGALISGIADVDAITLSMAELSRNGSVEPVTAGNAIVIAAASNTLVKGAMVWFLGNPRLRRIVGPAVFATVAVTLGLAFLL
jgi:uncharacterized membrane protein (DUF4010 family)